ncbi:MAG: hypothetical protein IJN39_00660, partial [Clostridia bacterium]|nr:hypothetical protein [Clostridia bacterium]
MDLSKNKVHAGLFSLLLCIPVLFRGLYFAEDFLAFSCLALLWVGICFIIGKNELRAGSLFDWILLAFSASYLISSAKAVSTYAALSEAVKYFVLFLVYLFAKNCFKSENSKTAFFEVLVYVLALSSVISLLTAAGIVNFEGAYSPSPIEKWLNGTVQYHNAFGILMLAGFFAASALNSHAVKSVKFAILGVCSYFLMFGLIMSYSR